MTSVHLLCIMMKICFSIQSRRINPEVSFWQAEVAQLEQYPRAFSGFGT